jgi:ADP-heptose:LPS heptosyltransferase
MAPGDIMCLTAVAKNIKLAYGNSILIDVRSAYDTIFVNNPFVQRIMDVHNGDFQQVDFHRYLRTTDYMTAWHMDGEDKFKIKIPIVQKLPELYLSPEEKRPFPDLPSDYLVCMNGHKQDTTTKHYTHYREVIEQLNIPVVLVGRKDHVYQEIPTAINWIGKTDNLRTLFRLIHNSRGCFGGITSLLHFSAALDRPYVALWGGREPRDYINYPKLLKIYGSCPHSPCWSLFTQKNDDYTHPKESPYKIYCDMPHKDGYASCLSNLDPNYVVDKIKCFLHI